jgi:cytochrome c-type biogenesis protein CcmH
MRTVNRRRFFQQSMGLAGGAVLGQKPAQDGAADPLPQPGWLSGTRAVVDSTFNDATVKAIEQKLRCTCGCGLDIFTCRTTDFTCTYSPALHQEVVDLLQRGNSPDAAIERLVSKYGEAILQAPKASGFGIVGYLLPGAAILVGASLIAWIVARKIRLRRPVSVRAADAPAPGAATSEEDRFRLEQALRELET